MEKKTELIRFTHSMTAKNREQLQAIQDELGLTSESEAIRTCIHFRYEKLFPNYARTGGIKLDQDQEIKESKVDKKKREALQIKANKIATAINICENDLNGAVAYDENGNAVMCAFFQYDGRRRWKQEVDINSVTTDLSSNQYLPNKERVMTLQAKGAIDYVVDQTVEEFITEEQEAK